MKKIQRGSILVTVIGLSILLVMGASTLLLVAGSAQNEESSTWQRVRCSNDAESGLMLGTAWLRVRAGNSVNPIQNNQGWPGNLQSLYVSRAFDNQCLVTVNVKDNAPAVAPAGPKRVIATAVGGGETVQMSWDVTAPGGPLASDGRVGVTVTNWSSP
jgi:hypothetical protein